MMVSNSSEHLPQDAEYSVYVYHHPERVEQGHTDWEMKKVTRNRRRAFKEAKKLYDMHVFERVEVKKKIFDHKADLNRDETLHILDASRRGVASGFARFLRYLRETF